MPNAARPRHRVCSLSAGAITASGTVNMQGAIQSNGTPGVATFGPSVVTSITVKNGLITAIS